MKVKFKCFKCKKVMEGVSPKNESSRTDTIWANLGSYGKGPWEKTQHYTGGYSITCPRCNLKNPIRSTPIITEMHHGEQYELTCLGGSIDYEYYRRAIG